MKRITLRIIGAILALPAVKFARVGKVIFPVVILGLVFARRAVAVNTVTMNVVDWFVSLIASFATYLAYIVGQLIVLLIGMIAVPLMQYNSFVTSPVVGMGWSVIRDAVNMFFVIILIIIAFGTILGVERFKWRQQIPGILIMAVLINFSRTLCGILIDFSQIIMLTFVNAIKDIAGGNFIQMFQLGETMDVNATAVNLVKGSQPVDLLGAALIALLMMLIVLVSLTFLTIALAWRIVLLWALVTLAPLAWFFKPVQGILGGAVKKNLYTEWWSRFSCALTLGPILVFFLWLALAVAGSGSISDSSAFPSSTTGEGLDTGSMLKAMDTNRMVSFIIGIMLLFIGLDAANDACAGADGIMSGLMGKAKGLSKGLVKAPVNLAAWGTKKGAKTIWSGSSGGGGIKGKILGSKLVNDVAKAAGSGPLRYVGGGMLANVVAKNRAGSAEARSKYDQSRISALSKAGGFDKETEANLLRFAKSGDKFTSRAAIQALSNKGYFKDDPTLTADQRKERVGTIKDARKKLADTPELLDAFDDKIRKQAPSFALDTIYRDDKGAIDQKKLREDITNLKIGAGAVLSSTNSGNAADVKNMMGGNAAERMKFMHDIFDGNIKNMTAAIGGIDDLEVRKALFGDVKNDAAGIATFVQKNKIDADGDTVDVNGTKTKDPTKIAKEADYDKINAILSSLVSNGIDVGDVNEYYRGRGGAGVVYDPQAAKKAMAKHVGSNADSYRDIFDDMSDSDPATGAAKITAAKKQLESIFTEVGDIISGEGIAKLRNGGNKLKGNVDEAMNISLVARATSFQNAPQPQQAELKIQLENAVERAVKGGAGINLSGIINQSNLTPQTQTVINTTISGSKAEDLIKMRFDSGSSADVGNLIWNGSNAATLRKILLDGTNKSLLKALDVYAASLSPTDPKRQALKEFFP